MSRRADQINQSLKREISRILLTDMNDIAVKLVTINRVDVSSDLHHAKVYLTPFGKSIDKNISTKIGGDSSGGNAINAKYYSKLTGLKTVNN